MVGCGKELNYSGYLGQCMVGRVSFLGEVKQGNPCVIYHTESKLHTFQTLSFHNNLPSPPPYFGYPDWESVTLCKYQHYPTLDIYLSLSFHSNTLPEYLSYPTNVGKIPLPTLCIYPTYPINVNSAYISIPTSQWLLLHIPACISLPYTTARA